MQVMCIEFARNVLKLPDANSTEFNPKTPDPIISLMADQQGIEDMGGTMRLGLWPCQLQPGSHAADAYAPEARVRERHRHRWEFNNRYRTPATDKGLNFTGLSPDGRLVEIAELDRTMHPWMLGVQFHPEFLSRPNRPHPLFKAFLKAVVNQKRKQTTEFTGCR